MKKFLVFLVWSLFSITVPLPAFASNADSAAPAIVKQWIAAMMNSGQGLNSIITPDFKYSQYSFEFKSRLVKGARGNLPFFAKLSTPIEITVEEIIPSDGGGYIAILNVEADTGLYRTWQIRLFVTPSGISKVSEIAMAGLIEGVPPGCPETVFKRDLAVTLHGNPAGLDNAKEIKLYSFRRDTDSWDFAHPGVDEKMFKYCSPRPDTYMIESEVVSYDDQGQLIAADTVAAKHKGEKQEEGFGGTFFDDNGTNFPGRLFGLGDGKEGLLLTFSVEKTRGNKTERVDPAKLYLWKGNSWKPVWGFTTGYNGTTGLFGGSANDVEWSLRSAGDGAGTATIIATLATNNDAKFSCPVGSTIIFEKKGSGFKPIKAGIPESCFKSKGATGIKASIKEDKGRTYHGETPEIDWRFQR